MIILLIVLTLFGYVKGPESNKNCTNLLSEIKQQNESFCIDRNSFCYPTTLLSAELDQMHKPSRRFSVPTSSGMVACPKVPETRKYGLEFAEELAPFLDDYLPLFMELFMQMNKSAGCGRLQSTNGPLQGTVTEATLPVQTTVTEATLPVQTTVTEATLPVQTTQVSPSPVGTKRTSNTTWLPSTESSESTLSTSLSPHNHSLTVVTALMDIGRGNWTQFNRPLCRYLKYMRYTLQLRVPMVVVVDQNSSFEFVRKERARIGWSQWTQIRQMSLQDLPLAKFLPGIRQIMKDEHANWRPEWDPEMRTHPEASNPEYVVLINSKTWFVAEAVVQNPFKTENFAWLDAGYGHGDRAIFPANWQWRPKLTPGKISLIKLINTDPMASYGIERLYRKNVAVIIAGVFVGDLSAIHHFCISWQRMFNEFIYKHMVDDDQFYMTLLVNQHPDLYTITEGDWFDAFKLL